MPYKTAQFVFFREIHARIVETNLGSKMSQSWNTVTKKISDLFLDPNNVRLDAAGLNLSQDELITDLFANQDAFDMAASFAKNGVFQHELPIVVEEGGKLVVIEGNRRVAALKALANPSLVPSFTAKLDKLKTSANLPIKEIEVKIAPSRKAVEPLLAAIHTSESRRRWAPLRQAYFYYAQIKTKRTTLPKLIAQYPDVDVVGFAKMWEMHEMATKLTYDTPEEEAKVKDQQNFSISTLERLYDNESFRSHMGLAFTTQGKVQISSKVDDFKVALKRVVQDIVNGEISTRTLNKADDIKKYIATVPKPEPGAGKAKAASSIKKERKSSGQTVSKFLAPKDMKCTLPYPAVSRVLGEMKKLDYAKFPNAAHDLLRSFLECSLKAFFDHLGDPVVPANKNEYSFLSDVLLHAEKYFENARKTDKTLTKYLTPIKLLRQSAGTTQNTFLFSKDFLDALNHSHVVFSTGPQVKEAWDHMEPLLRYVLNPK
ncbi:MAG: hypothetical protein JST12_13095 [Armatimonadetes bacterium]|nr:hypothetical protein [Armatimonadota bacterium]